MAEKKISKSLQSAITDIGSGDKKRIDHGISFISSKGHLGVIKPLMNLLISSKDKDLHKSIGMLLSDIQDEKACGIIMDFLNDGTYKALRKEVLNSIWNSKLDYSSYIADFVALAVEGDFIESVECLTVIENMRGPFQEQDLLEAQLFLKDYYSNRKGYSDQKNEIISEIALFIKDQNEGVDADLLLE
jgi:hypothetical protein